MNLEGLQVEERGLLQGVAFFGVLLILAGILVPLGMWLRMAALGGGAVLTGIGVYAFLRVHRRYRVQAEKAWEIDLGVRKPP